MLGGEQAQRATRFCCSISSPWLDTHGNCQGPGGWVRGTVGAMDGAIEPHGRVYGVSREPILPGPIA